MSAEALEAKARGNVHFKAQKWDDAIREYSEAIAVDSSGPSSHTFFSNRSACFAAKGDYRSALDDAEKCIELKPDFAKGFSRKGLALFKLGKLADAKSAYEQGLTIAPSDAGLKQALEQTDAEIERRKSAPSAAGGAPAGGLFGPDLYTKINSHPELREFAKDPSFLQKVQMLQTNPQMAISSGLLSDPQIAKLFEVMMGLKMGGPPGAGGDDGGAAADASGDGDVSMTSDSKFGTEADDTDSDDDGDVTISSASGSKSKSADKLDEKAEEEKRKAKEEADAKAALEAEALRKRREELKRREEAEKHKKRGNDLYQEKKFDEAIAEYRQAFEIDSTNPAYLLNESAVLFMQQKWDETVAKCEEAIALCRKVYADLKWTQKAYVRMANVAEKKKDLQLAIDLFKKAQIEKKDAKIKKKIKELTAKMTRKKQAEYLDPEKSLEHKAKGNEFFKAGKFEEALQEYSEAIKRNPKDPALYSNRATTFCKLMGWEAAMEDCDKCLKLDPKYIKAWIRKGKVYHVLKQYHQSLKCFREASKIDSKNPDLVAAQRDTQMAIQRRNMSDEVDEAARARALEDPDVKAAMNDPEVSSVLTQAQAGDSSILMRAMRDRPHIAEKIELLMAAGVLTMR